MVVLRVRPYVRVMREELIVCLLVYSSVLESLDRANTFVWRIRGNSQYYS
jgi:hypothetical protein